jgi:hypothetical protein
MPKRKKYAANLRCCVRCRASLPLVSQASRSGSRYLILANANNGFKWAFMPFSLCFILLFAVG